MIEVSLRIEIVEGAEDLPLPEYQSAWASGLDLHANIPDRYRLAPGEQLAIPCGIKLQMPEGYEGQVRPRSGMAFRCQVWACPGTIDSDYRGEIHCLLRNFSALAFWIDRGDRIGQLIISPVARAVLIPVRRVDTTRRGPGGFGSTGRAA